MELDLEITDGAGIVTYLVVIRATVRAGSKGISPSLHNAGEPAEPPTVEGWEVVGVPWVSFQQHFDLDYVRCTQDQSAALVAWFRGDAAELVARHAEEIERRALEYYEDRRVA